ncbi:MAG TPA: hypothetical protein VK638_55650 [Edaphobacter sp.]|nr:hypothetical protein [Edaphobacter sp.]
MQTKLIAALALCPLLFSQTAEKSQAVSESITKIIRVHSDPRPLVELVGGPGSAANVQGNSALRVIVARGTPAGVAAVERIIHDLDTIGDTDSRGRNIELVIYVLLGSMEIADGRSESDITALAPVYKQLLAVFPFKRYHLLNTMLMRSGQSTFTGTQGMMKSLQNNADLSIPGSYRIQYDAASVSGDVSPIIHLNKFQFSAKIPFLSGTIKNKDGTDATTQYQQGNIGIETNLDLREGQKVVVGTSNVEPAGSTIFVVVTAKLL